MVAFAVLARTLLADPLPLWVAAAAMGAYLGLIALGIALPRLEMFGDAVSRGGPGAKIVALTFDDGPHPDTTRVILAILAREGDQATFFVVGEKVDRHPEVVREILAAGHTLAVHGYRHTWLHACWSPHAVAADIERARDAVERAAGVRPRYFRPPIGIVSPRTAAGARRAGAPIVLFDTRTGDGVPTRVERVVRRATARLRDGSIVLLHDAAERDDRAPASLAALPRILERLRSLGLTPKGVEVLVGDEPYLPRRVADPASPSVAGATTVAGAVPVEAPGVATEPPVATRDPSPPAI